MSNELQGRHAKNQTKSIEIKCGISIDVTPVLGACVRLGNTLASAKMGERLLEGDDWAIEGYDGCDFRYPTAIKQNTVAVNVKITGRKTTSQWGDEYVRCQVEFVGDCEESTFVKGFLLLDENTCVNGF
jgi:hypothetical protein